jgi:FK506-binding protein 4/5
MALSACNKAIEIEPDSEKGHLCRGQAHFGLQEYDLALQDFDRVLAINPDSKAATIEIGKVNLAKKKHWVEVLYAEKLA